MPTTYECDKCCCEFPQEDLKKIDNPDIDGRFIYVCIGCDDDPDGSWYESDEVDEDTTRKVCCVCKNESSCGNYNWNHEWFCAECGSKHKDEFPPGTWGEEESDDQQQK